MPGVCTSTPIKFLSGICPAIWAVVSPMPVPISKIVGAVLEKTCVKSSGALV